MLDTSFIFHLHFSIMVLVSWKVLSSIMDCTDSQLRTHFWISVCRSFGWFWWFFGSYFSGSSIYIYNLSLSIFEGSWAFVSATLIWVLQRTFHSLYHICLKGVFVKRTFLWNTISFDSFSSNKAVGIFYFLFIYFYFLSLDFGGD